jgi:saccharopine dehydrogenase-like NADP-dependent oxidoreductase
MVWLYIILFFILFLIIYLAARLAINPLIPRTSDREDHKEDAGLVKLRDIEVLTNTELEEIIELYHNKSVKNKDRLQYEKYLNVLKELKEIGYFTHEEYAKRLEKLNEYYFN